VRGRRGIVTAPAFRFKNVQTPAAGDRLVKLPPVPNFRIFFLFKVTIAPPDAVIG